MYLSRPSSFPDILTAQHSVTYEFDDPVLLTQSRGNERVAPPSVLSFRGLRNGAVSSTSYETGSHAGDTVAQSIKDTIEQVRVAKAARKKRSHSLFYLSNDSLFPHL